VAAAVVDALADLDLKFPTITSAQAREIARAKKLLDRKDDKSGH
jgi:hypothetical protein